VHEVAADATGTAAAVMPNGTMRASIAEIAGSDLKGLGLALTQSKQETAIHCAVASFQADNGSARAQSLLLDTESVLITGEGQLHLDSEALDLTFHGHPKNAHLLHVRTEPLLRGTFKHPTFALRAGGAAVQPAAAVTSGGMVPPPAAMLAFVDPGLAHDADCTSVAGQAGVSGR
jgi:hypothetical protein